MFSLNVEANLLEYDPNRPVYDKMWKTFNKIDNNFSLNVDDYVIYTNNKILNKNVYNNIKNTNSNKNYSNFSFIVDYYNVNNNRGYNFDFDSDNYIVTFNLNKKLFLSLSKSKVNYDRHLNVLLRDILILGKINFIESEIKDISQDFYRSNKMNSYNVLLSLYDKDYLTKNIHFNKFFSYSYNNDNLEYRDIAPCDGITYFRDTKKKYIKHNFFGKLDVDYIINMNRDYNLTINTGFEYNTINKNNNNTFLFISSIHLNKKFLNNFEYDIFLTTNKNMNKHYLIINKKKELLEKDNIESGFNLNYILTNKINFNFKTSYRSDKIKTLNSYINFDLYF